MDTAIHGVRKFDALFGLDLKEEIKRVCSLPVVFLNDASAYALGEYYGGAAQGSERSMVVTVGTGLGSTFMAREEILDETTPAVPEHGYLYNIPFRDSIADDYFSTRWFVTNWNHRFPDKAVMDVKTLAEYAYRGEQAAKVLFEEFADHFPGRYFSTPKKMGAQTAEANINAGIAAARQIVGFLKDGCEKFRVNKK